MDYGNLLNLLVGSNKKLVEGTITEMESEAVDDPTVAPSQPVTPTQRYDKQGNAIPLGGFLGGPDPVAPVEVAPAELITRGTGTGEGITRAMMPIQSPPSEELANLTGNLLPNQSLGTLQTAGSGVAIRRDTPVISQPQGEIPVTPNPLVPGLTQRAQLPMPTPEGISMPPQSPQNEFDGMTVKPLTELQRAQQEATAARNQKVKKHAKWKDVLAYIVQGANAAFNPAPGQKIVGYGQVKKDNAIRAAEEKLQKVQGDAMKNAQIKQIQDAPELAAQRLAAQNLNKIFDLRGKLAKMTYFDPKNPLHRQMAKDVQLNPDELGWDNRNSDKVQIAGRWYNQDPATKVWGPTEGLPTDDSKSVIEYEVSMPDANGQYTKRIFKVQQGDAAKFAMQMNMLDAQFKQREKEADVEFKRKKELKALDAEQQTKLTRLKAEIEASRDAITLANQKDLATFKDAQARERERIRREALQKAVKEKELEAETYINSLKADDGN